ncbi:MAG: hypothetical protein H6741_16225 [Alphaproteobacteria bacterium]|nr:hypothetical protein [Alphaproteobacteria bacterium]MCB9794261.1 hypothetical protein [Alphaproteobacteria bacterium]
MKFLRAALIASTFTLAACGGDEANTTEVSTEVSAEPSGEHTVKANGDVVHVDGDKTTVTTQDGASVKTGPNGTEIKSDEGHVKVGADGSVDIQGAAGSLQVGADGSVKMKSSGQK